MAFFGAFCDNFGSGFGNFSGNFAQKRVSNTHFLASKWHPITPLGRMRCVPTYGCHDVTALQNKKSAPSSEADFIQTIILYAICCVLSLYSSPIVF